MFSLFFYQFTEAMEISTTHGMEVSTRSCPLTFYFFIPLHIFLFCAAVHIVSHYQYSSEQNVWLINYEYR